jgi:hypothetical protein
LEKSFTHHVQTLHILFENGFAEAYGEANTRKRRRVMPYVSALHRRWYYSTLIESTPFSPANIMEAMCLHHGEDTSNYPLSVLRNKGKFSGFDVKVTNYASGAHPVIGDLRLLVDFCLPHIDIREGDYFFDNQILDLAETLTIPDPAYASFLLDLAMKMKLLEKIPSLYINRIGPARNCAERLAPDKDPQAFFTEIIDASIQVCAYHLRNLIALPEMMFTDSYVRAMLTDPIDTDALFEQVYDLLGYTLEDLVALSMESDEAGFDEQDGAFLAGTFIMGLVLDQHFYTPFGSFLKLIKPMYVLPFDFATEIDDFLASKVTDNDEVFIAFFAPCSSYTLTDLGLRVLNIKPNRDNYYDVNQHMPFSTLKDTLFADPAMISVLIKMAQFLPAAIGNLSARPVYTFRIRMEEDPAMWIHLHMPATAFLEDIYEEVLDYFPLRDNYDYSFFHDVTENRFVEYPSLKRANPRSKKNSNIPLSDLDFEHQNKMLLAAYTQTLPFGGKPPTVRLEIEMMGMKEPDPGQDYPRVARMSKAVREMEEDV